MTDGLLSLSWNNHTSTFCHMLSSLRDKERYTDVTITCDGKFYPVHKFVLSTCSDYFLKMFERTPCKHPIIVLKDIQSREIEALLSYMYDGVVSVAQNDLSPLIKAAELLQIKGLAVPDEPPSPNKRTQNMRGSTDDRKSPHPKRQKRDQTPNHTQNENQGSNGVQPSSNSPFRQEKDSIPDDSMSPRLPNRTEQRGGKDNEKGSERLEFQGSQRQEQDNNVFQDHSVSHHSSQAMGPLHITKDSPHSDVEVMVDENLVKEEILDTSNEGNISDTGLDYGSLASDLGVDTSGGGMEDHSTLNLAGSFDHTEGHTYDSQAGPSGLQGWPVMSDSGEVSTQDYCQDMNQDVPMPAQPGPLPQQAHHMMDACGMGTDVSGILGTVETLSGGSKRHLCPCCDYTTNDSTSMKRHIRTHTGEKPFMCPYCSVRMTRKATMLSHMLSHTGEKPYSCNYCSYESRQKSNITRHMKTYHGQNGRHPIKSGMHTT